MFISLNKKSLAEAVGSVARFAERKAFALPALSAIVITAEKEKILLRATNLETGLEVTIDGTVRTPGVVAVPATVLREITASFSGEGTVSLEQSKDIVVLSTDKGKSSIKTLPHDDIPPLSVPETPKITCTIQGAVFRSLITTVAPYASVSTVRPELSSIFLSLEGGVLKAVATDSFRLAEKKTSIPGSLSPFSLLIPAKNATELIQNIPDSEITLQADEHQCALSWEGATGVSRLIALSYPDYQQIIPKKSTGEATVLKKDFEAALRRTAVFSDSFQKIRLSLDVGSKKISLSASSADIGEAQEEVTASTSGESIELSFNHKYLSAPLSSIQTESIQISASGIGRPLIIRPASDQSFLYLVMPMNQ